MKLGTPLFKRDRIHVVRFFTDDGEYRTLRTRQNFNSARRYIAERYGKTTAATAVSWGWQ